MSVSRKTTGGLLLLTLYFFLEVRVADDLYPVFETIYPYLCDTIVVHDWNAKCLCLLTPFGGDVVLEVLISIDSNGVRIVYHT